MIPHQFTLIGAKGIKAGLNKDQITIELAGSGTTAIKGDNGSGKSTILNLGLTPWRELPHIENMYEHFENTGQRELRWTHGDAEYRSVIKYHQNGAVRTQKAFLSTWDDDRAQWIPFRMDNGTESDGKCKIYDACLESILGPKSIYFASAFRAQNGEKIHEYKNPKSLMRQLLSLDHVEQIAIRAMGLLRRLTDERDRIARKIQDGMASESELESIRDEISKHDQMIGSAREELEKNEIELVSEGVKLTVAIEAEKEKDAKLLELETKMEAHKKRETIKSEALKNRIDQEKGRIVGLRRTYQNDMQKIESAIKSATESKEYWDALVSEKQEIGEAALLSEKLDKDIRLREANEKELMSKLEQARLIRHNAKNAEYRKNQAQYRAETLGQRIAYVSEIAGFIGQVPCGGVSPYDTCPALRKAQEAKKQIPGLQNEITDATNAKDDFDRLTAELYEESAKFDDIGEELTRLQNEISDAKSQLNSIKDKAAKASLADAAEASALQADKTINDLRERHKAEMDQHIRTIEAIKADIDEYKGNLEEFIMESFREYRRLDDEKKLLCHRKPQEQVKKLENECLSLKLLSAQLRNCIHDYQRNNAELMARLDYMEKANEALEAQRSLASNFSDEISLWHLFVAGLRGVMDLSIEEAGPAITVIANQLLASAYGPRFSVRLVTQKQLRNGKTIETFDLSVIDTETEVETDMGLKSGGERVWLEKAISDAIAIWYQSSSGIPYECLFADEVEDGLTEERKGQFYAMDKEMLKLGGFQRKIFISHNRAAWEFADNVIDLADYMQI